MSFAALILAAGASRRMGCRNKLLLDLGGMPLAARALDSVRASGVAEIVVVLGHEAEKVRAVLKPRAGPSSRPPGPAGGRPEDRLRGYGHAGGPFVRFVTNADYREGLASSLVCGLRTLEQAHAGVAVCLGDMPFVEPQLVDALCAALRPGDYAAVPVRQGTWGNPAVLSPEAVRDAMTLTGDRGARALLRRRAAQVREVAAPSDAVLRDIDRPGDLRLS